MLAHCKEICVELLAYSNTRAEKQHKTKPTRREPTQITTPTRYCPASVVSPPRKASAPPPNKPHNVPNYSSKPFSEEETNKISQKETAIDNRSTRSADRQYENSSSNLALSLARALSRSLAKQASRRRRELGFRKRQGVEEN